MLLVFLQLNILFNVGQSDRHRQWYTQTDRHRQTDRQTNRQTQMEKQKSEHLLCKAR